jgi:hypothetical protein
MEIGQLFSTGGGGGTTPPMLQRPSAPSPVARDLGEVPRALRPQSPVVNSPAELAARRNAAEARRAEEERVRLDDNYDNIKAFMGGEEAWTVQTPGGSVIAGGTERPAAPQAEPRPTLGAN